MFRIRYTVAFSRPSERTIRIESLERLASFFSFLVPGGFHSSECFLPLSLASNQLFRSLKIQCLTRSQNFFYRNPLSLDFDLFTFQKHETLYLRFSTSQTPFSNSNVQLLIHHPSAFVEQAIKGDGVGRGLFPWHRGTMVSNLPALRFLKKPAIGEPIKPVSRSFLRSASEIHWVSLRTQRGEEEIY